MVFEQFFLIMLMADDGSNICIRCDFSTVDEVANENLSIDLDTLFNILGEEPQHSQVGSGDRVYYMRNSL